MARLSVVTGAASGIGQATRALLLAQGEEVIGVDLKGADITADLTTPDGRQHMVEEVAKRSGSRIDAIYAIAGISAPIPATIAVNFFGATATLDGLRPLLTGSPAPRAVAIVSMASLQPNLPELVDACLAGDEALAMDIATRFCETNPEQGYVVYPSSKAALARWIRRNAPTDAWAGAGIALNGVAPGVVLTPMTAELLATEEGRKSTFDAVPSPLGGAIEATDIAKAVAFLGSQAANHICGQVLFVDSGCDAVTRGDSTW